MALGVYFEARLLQFDSYCTSSAQQPTIIRKMEKVAITLLGSLGVEGIHLLPNALQVLKKILDWNHRLTMTELIVIE